MVHNPFSAISPKSNPPGPVHCVTFSAGVGQYVSPSCPSSIPSTSDPPQILTGSADRTIRLFNPLKAPVLSTASQQQPPPGLVQSYSSHGYAVLDITVASDNARFASVGGDKQVFLWDVAGGRTLRRWAGHGGRVNCVGFGSSDEGVVVSGTWHCFVLIVGLFSLEDWVLVFCRRRRKVSPRG